MSKKFGKIMLIAAAVSGVAATAAVLLRKREHFTDSNMEEDEYEDDFCEDLDDENDVPTRSYVPLTHPQEASAEEAKETDVPQNAEEEPAREAPEAKETDQLDQEAQDADALSIEADKTAVDAEEAADEAAQAAADVETAAMEADQTADKLEETVEEFFDEDDASDEEPPIIDN